MLMPEEEKKHFYLLFEYRDVFAWSYSLMPLAPSMFEVFLEIVVTVASIFEAIFLINKTDARRLSNVAIRLRRLTI